MLMDSGPFFRFCEAGKLLELAIYIGERAEVTTDVRSELALRGSSPKPHLRTHPGLQNLARLNFPSRADIQLAPELIAVVETIRSQWAEDHEHPKAHLGEISTVIAAHDLGHRLTVIDDIEGLKLAQLRKVHTIKTTHVVAEMVAAGKLSEDDGWPIFHTVRSGSKARYEAAVAAYRTALSS